MDETTKKVSNWTVRLVVVVAIGAFVLSYFALQDTAAKNGLPPVLSHIWPLLIDFALVVFSLAVVRASLLGERTWWPWGLVILSTVATIVFNLAHAGEGNMAKAVAVVPPVALFLSFETLMGMMRHNAKRAGLVAALKQLEAAFQAKQQEFETAFHQKRQELSAILADLQGKIDVEAMRLQGIRTDIDATIAAADVEYAAKFTALERKRKELVDDIARLLKDKHAVQRSNDTTDNVARQTKKVVRQEQVRRMVLEDMTQADIAANLGTSIRTVQRDMAEMGIVLNGNGSH